MFDKVAILGDQDLVFAFKAIGLKVFSPQSVEEARRILDDLEKENFAVCFLEESLYESLREERKALREKFCPVVIGFSDYRQISGYIDKIHGEDWRIGPYWRNH